MLDVRLFKADIEIPSRNGQGDGYTSKQKKTAVGSQIFGTDSLKYTIQCTYTKAIKYKAIKYMLLEWSGKLRITNNIDQQEIQDMNELNV